MRNVEHTLESEDLAALNAALNDASGSEDIIWSRDIDVGEGNQVEVMVRGGGKDDEPWVDVVLLKRNGETLKEPYSLDVGDGPFGELILEEVGVTISLMNDATPSPSM